MRWQGSFLAYARVGVTIQRALELQLASDTFIPTLTNKLINMLHEHGMNFHSPVPAHLKRACQDCFWADYYGEYYGEDDDNGA